MSIILLMHLKSCKGMQPLKVPSIAGVCLVFILEQLKGSL